MSNYDLKGNIKKKYKNVSKLKNKTPVNNIFRGHMPCVSWLVENEICYYIESVLRTVKKDYKYYIDTTINTKSKSYIRPDIVITEEINDDKIKQKYQKIDNYKNESIEKVKYVIEIKSCYGYFSTIDKEGYIDKLKEDYHLFKTGKIKDENKIIRMNYYSDFLSTEPDSIYLEPNDKVKFLFIVLTSNIKKGYDEINKQRIKEINESNAHFFRLYNHWYDKLDENENELKELEEVLKNS